MELGRRLHGDPRLQDGGQAARPDRRCGQQRVPPPDDRAVPEAAGRGRHEPRHDRWRGRGSGDQAAAGQAGPEVGQADPARLVDAEGQEEHPGELLAEPRADL